MINCFCIWTIGDEWEVGVGLGGGGGMGSRFKFIVWSRNYAFVLAIRTVNLKCCDCCAEQKTSKDFSSFFKTQNFGGC